MMTHDECKRAVQFWVETFPDDRVSPPVIVDITEQIRRVSDHLDLATVAREMGTYKRRLGVTDAGYRKHADIEAFLVRLREIATANQKREIIRRGWIDGMRRDASRCELEPEIARFYLTGADHIEQREVWSDFFARCEPYFARKNNEQMHEFCETAVRKLTPFDRPVATQGQLAFTHTAPNEVHTGDR